MRISEYEIEDQPTVRITLSVGVPAWENRNWYITRGPGNGFSDDYWRDGKWYRTNPQRFATAEEAECDYLAKRRRL